MRIPPSAAVAALTALLVAAGGESAPASPVVVDSAGGPCHVRRAGASSWQRIGKGERLYDNDVVRLGDSAGARVRWGTGGVVFLHANTLLQVNLYEDAERGTRLKHATVFFGAAFFVLKHTLPRFLAPRKRTRIYTPTAVIAIRGTSFEVAVEQATGATDIGVVAGTVLVGNILHRRYRFVGAGHQTRVALNADPVEPGALPADRLEALRGWVPAEVVERETARQRATAKQDRTALAEADRSRVAVTPLVNHSTYRGAWRLGSRLGELLTNAISGDTAPLASLADTLDPVAAGTGLKARYALSGTVERFEIVRRAMLSPPADEYRETATAVVALRLELIDIVDGILVWEATVSGEASEPVGPRTSWSTIAKAPLDPADKKFAATIVGKALARALDDAAAEIGRQVGGRE